ncbi:MAG TPA: protein kinase [Blastocatellia bacterium]
MIPPEEWQRAEAIYHSALEQLPENRAAFVARACAGDQRLRDEVTSLLAARDRAGSFLAAPAIEEVAKHLAAQKSFAGQSIATQSALIGQSLNQYRIVAAIGKGGMGEVYLAEDTRLHRRVALKLLPAEFITDQMRVRRFEQEARAVSALNHPNIVTLYDVGRCGDEYFMATEFVEGRTLRDCLNERGRLPANESCEITAQIAAALRAAHDAGIVHRDIKPENVMLRRDGYVKVLDFGLAKLSKERLASAPESSLTEAGTVMGTVSYLSPEQARGMPVDARTDVFSLGVVCYEMLAGRLPFAGQTANDVIASILRSDPPPLADAALNCVVMKALAKDCAARHQTVADFAGEIKQLSEEIAFEARLADSKGKSRRCEAVKNNVASAGSYETVPIENTASRALALPFGWGRLTASKLLVGTAFTLLAVFAGWLYFTRGQVPTDALPNGDHRPIADWTAERGEGTQILSVSPDGKTIAFSKAHDGRSDIYAKRILDGNERNLTEDDEEDFSPIWSPNGERLAYLSKYNGKTEVRTIPFYAGGKETLAPLEEAPRWLTRWSRDDTRIYFERDRNLYALDIASGQVNLVTNFPVPGSSKSDFALSADEEWIAYQEASAGVVQIFAQRLAGGERTQVTHEGRSNTVPQWHPDGKRLIYSSKRNSANPRQLYVAYLDGRTPVKLLNSQESLDPWEVSADGRQIYYFSTRDEADLYLIDVNTPGIPPELQLSEKNWQAVSPNFAPDGDTVAFQRIVEASDFFEGAIFRQPLGGGPSLQLTANGFDPRWSPRGDKLAFLRLEGRNSTLWTVGRDGGPEQLVAGMIPFTGGIVYHPYGWTNAANFSWSPRGDKLAYVFSNESGVVNLHTSALDGSQSSPIFANSDPALKLFSPIWSPDGQRLAYVEQHFSRTPGKEMQRRLVVSQAGVPKEVFSTSGYVRLLGWSDNSQELFAGVQVEKELNDPALVELWRLPLDGRSKEIVKELPSAYLPSLLLAPNSKQVAFVARQNEMDNVHLVSLETKSRRPLTANTSETVNLSGLTWARKQNLLCYIKQSNAVSIWMIENFK